jgi:hypothetical protein
LIRETISNVSLPFKDGGASWLRAGFIFLWSVFIN